MNTLYSDPAFDYPVPTRLRAYIDGVFFGELLNQTTCIKVQQFLEQLVPGSTWKVGMYGYTHSLTLRVQFQEEKYATLYLLRWS